nr:MAG TPA: head tail connector [Caudoviricetes sp.]
MIIYCTSVQMEEEFVSLEMIKTHLNIEQGYKLEDDYLLHLRSVSFLAVQNHICSDLATLNGHKEAIGHCLLLLIGTLYLQRESIGTSSMKECPHTLGYILDQYKNYSG